MNKKKLITFLENTRDVQKWDTDTQLISFVHDNYKRFAWFGLLVVSYMKGITTVEYRSFS